MGVDELHALAGGEDNFTGRRRDDAVVLHLRRNEINKPAVPSLYLPLVNNFAGSRHLIELEATREKIRIAKSQGTGNKSCGINNRASAHKHAIRIYQEHAPIGEQLAKNTGGLAAGYPVEH